MTERNRWDSKRRSPLSDPRRGTGSSSASASTSSGSGRGSYDREKDRERDRDHRRERSYRHDKDKDKDSNKKDRYHNNHSNHHRKHSGDSHRSDSRDRSSDSSNSHRPSRHDDHRGTVHDHRSSASMHKGSYNQKHRESPSNSSYSSSSYSTPPPAPPGPPPAPPSPHPIGHSPHVLPPTQQHHIAPVVNTASHLGGHSMLHASAHHAVQTGNHSSLFSSPHSGVKSQSVGLPSSLHNTIHTIAPTVQNILSHYQTHSNIYNMDNSANHSTPSNRADPRLSERRTSDPRRNAPAASQPVVEEVKKNFKLLIDPSIKKGHAKVIRYDGVLTGQPPVTPKDPRRVKSKVWTIDVCDLPIPDMKIDKNYVGPMPRNIVRFSGLNDNVNRKFLYELCEAYGDIKEYKVYFDPKTNKHLGTGKVVFDEKTSTDNVIAALNNRQVMGSTITVWIDIKKPPGLTMLKQLQLECLKARPPQSGFMHHIGMKSRGHMKTTQQLSTPQTPKISAMNRSHPVAGPYNHTQAGYSTHETAGSGGYYKNTNNPSPRLVSTPPPPPPKKHYEDISPTGREADRTMFNNGNYLTYLSNTHEKSGLSLIVCGAKSATFNSISNSKCGISPISPALKELTPLAEKPMFSNYESISPNEHLPHVEDISPAVTPTPDVDPRSNNKNKVESDDAMSLSSISSNEDSKVELNVSSQFLSQTTQSQIIQPVLIPVSDQLSKNQTVMNYISSAPLQHLFPPGPLHPPPQPCPPPQSHAPSQSHPPLQTHPPPAHQQLPPPPTHQQLPPPPSHPAHQQLPPPPTHQQLPPPPAHQQLPPPPAHQQLPPPPAHQQLPPPPAHQQLPPPPAHQQLPPPPAHQQSPLQQSPSPHQPSPLHQQSPSHSKTTTHLQPPCPPAPLRQEPPACQHPSSYQQPPPQSHPPPPQQYQQQHQHHPHPSQNRSGAHPAGPIDYKTYNPKAILQQRIYNNRTSIPHSSSAHSISSVPNTTTNTAVKNNSSEASLKTNYHTSRPSAPLSVSEKHADILRKALYGQSASTSGVSNYARNYTSLQPYSTVLPPVRQPPPIPKELPFLFQVKSGVARDLSIELKRILKKDTLKKLVEQSAFAFFENWWEKQRTPQSKPAEVDKLEPISKVDSNLGSRKMLSDKTTNINPNTIQTVKDSSSTTSALIQTLFSRDKNNENRPPPSTTMPSKFLNTYRISRKQEDQRNMKVSHISRKRRPWPSLNQSKRKLQRLEDSEDEDMEDDEEEATADEDNQFEQFAMKQRQKQKSGSSLYQKIYSDESDNDDDDDEDDDDDVKGAKTQSDDDEEAEKADAHSSLSSSSSSSSDSSTSLSSSESELSESETEDGIKQEPCQETEFVRKSNEDVDPCAVALPKQHVELKTPSSPEPESETEEEVTEADDETEPDEDLEEGSGKHKVAFRSMYDEPRRRAVQDAERRMRELHAKLKGKKKSKSRDSKVSEETDSSTDEEEATKEKQKSIVKASEESNEEQLEPLTREKQSETGGKLSSAESIESIEVEEESVVEDDSTPEDEPATPINEEPIDEEELLNNEDRDEEDLMNNLIMFEHSYFFKTPSIKIEAMDMDVSSRSGKFIKKTFDSLMDTKRLYGQDVVKHRFNMRTTLEETNIIWDIVNIGVDAEDLDYLKEAFDSLVQIGAKEVENLCWVDHPITIIPPPKVKRGKAETKLRVHKSGSARTEGFYRIPIAEKAQYLKSALKQLSVMQRHDIGTNVTTTQAGTEHHKMKSRENRAMQRRLASSIAQEEYGTLMNYNQTLKTRKRYLKFARSHIHNWGLFACEPIASEEFVCEYIGQMIRSIVAEVREQRYEKSGIGSSYLFRLDMDSVIDATKTGCNARFVNHSCQPNCYAKVILVEGAKKIVIYSKRDIKVGEEITYDYKFPIEDDKIPCMCGSPQCRGSLN